ncbi:MAG: hypothetical protein ACPLKZ_06240 [Candidatus Bathyarchaeales archaeon]
MMSNRISRHGLFLAILLLAAFVVPVFASSYEELREENAKRRALSFLRDVFSFVDLAEYNVSFKLYVFDYPWDWGGATYEEVVRYDLISSARTLDFTIHFCNQTPYYVWLTDYDYYGPALFQQFDRLAVLSERVNVVKLAKSVLENYLRWRGDSSLRAAVDVLDMVNATESMSKIVGNLNFTAIWWLEDSVSFYWIWQVGGISAKRMGLSIDRRSFYLSDNGGVYRLGSAEVKISKDEAVAIALRRAESFSYRARIDLNTSVEVKDFVVVKDRITAELLTWPKEPLVLYPYWSVKLGLDKVYPAFVDAIHVGIWADTGEVFFCEPIGWGGPVSADGSSAETQPEGDVGDGEAAAGQTWQTSAIVVAAVVVTATVLGVAVLKRKRKQ